MEAEEYFSTYDALHKDDSTVRRLEIRLRNVSSIGKVVWSSFDFMCGPELKFVWEVTPSNSVSPLNLSSGEGSANDEESLVSSLSTQSAQYEDIDDPLQTNLTSTGELYDSMLMDDCLFRDYSLLSRDDGNTSEELRYLDELMQDSHISASDSNSTVTNSMVQEDVLATKSVSSTLTLSLVHDEEHLVQADEVADSTTVVDPVIGTPTELLNNSMPPSSDSSLQEHEDNLEMGSGANSSTPGNTTVGDMNASTSPSTKILEDERMTERDGETDEKECEKSTNVLTTSCVDSGVGGTISTHSELSGFCLSPLAELLPEAPKTPSSPFKDSKLTSNQCRGSTNDDDISVLDLSINVPEHPTSDEIFVSKFVLAEQVFSTQLPSNPLMHKMTVVPSRSLLVGSFIFSISQLNGSKTLYAISFLMNDCKLEWYMERQAFIESVVLDIVPKLKASLMTEPWEDVVVRANLALTRLVNLISILDRYPLISELCPLSIKNTLLLERCQDDKILSKAISGALQSQGQCVIIGSNAQYVSRLLHTLAAFLPRELRWCCPRMYRHKFSPYVRLQAVQRHELPYVMQCGALANWPLCVVDVDRTTVCMSAQYSRHRVLKQRADAQRIDIILNNTLNSKPVNLELSPCRVLECVKAFMRRMDTLPLEQSARMGLVNQLLLHVENMARALILYVKHASEPLPSEKSSAIKSSRFSLSECRSALDLQSDSWFHAVLARAELILPDIAEFICASS